MGGNFAVWQGKKRRKALGLSSIFDAVQAEKGPPRWRFNVVNTGSYPSAALAIYSVVSMQKIKACIALEKRSK